MVLGVSFLATPIKFRAASLTLPVALDVGRTTFHAFGRVEWALTIGLVALAVGARAQLQPFDWFLVGLVLVIVVAQAVWLIPQLDLRVAAVIAGEPLPPSPLHQIYAGAEVAKAMTLVTIGAWTANHL